MRYENDGSGTRELRSKIRVQSQAGLSIGGQLVFDYNALDEQIEVRSIRVLKKDGSVVTAGLEAVQDLSAPITLGAPMYTDARQKHVTVPGLSVGDVVEYDVMIHAKPVLTGQFWRIRDFTDRYIVLDDQLDLDVPNSRALKIKNPEGIEAAISVQGDRRLYHWATSNLKTPPPIDIFKKFEFNVTKLLEGPRPFHARRVMFSSLQSWAEVAEWYGQLERERRATTPEILSMADEITRGLPTDEAKAEALYYWVSQNIRYVSLSFGVGRYQPHAAAEVLANRYGDCKDKTTLLEALLEAKGMHAQPALVSMITDIDPSMPNPMQFDHAIAHLRLGDKDLWLDTTVGVSPFGYLMPQLRSKEALVVADRAITGLQTMPQDFPFTVESRIKVEGTIDKQGILDAAVEFQTRGDLEVLMRLLDAHVSREQLGKSADSVLVSTNRFLYGTVKYTDFKVANPAEIAHPVRAQFHVNGKLMSVDPNAAPARLSDTLASLAMSQLRLLSHLPALEPTTSALSGQSEQSPIVLNGPRLYALDLNVTFSDMAKSDVPPAKEMHEAGEFAEFSSRDSWQGSTYHDSKFLEFRVSTIPVSAASEYLAFTRKITDAFVHSSPDMTVATKAEPATAKPKPSVGKYLADPEVQDLYKRGEDESKRKNWANAIDAFGSATKADPHFPDAWRELGRARMYERQYTEAEAAFRKYLELAPDDHLAYLNMAWVLFNEKKFEEERDLMLKRIAVAPNDGDALYRLGTAYLALHQPAEAVPVFERSIVQFPKYRDAHYDLGRAYLQNHQDLLAQESFRRVVALDDSEGILNNVAYQLAEHSVSLDLAEGWSQRSIDVVEKELNGLALANVQSGTWGLVAKAGFYWDTMGWIKFRQGKLAEAEKYVLASWQIGKRCTTLPTSKGFFIAARSRGHCNIARIT